MTTVLVLQHNAIETPGLIGDALSAAGVQQWVTHGYRGDPVPRNMEGADGLLVMGGPMGVYEQDKFPFLTDEIRLIQDALRTGKPVLGVCLGSQLLAAALGARVYKGKQKEIGWYPVALTEEAKSDPLFTGMPATFTALHWHGDVFDLPDKAVHLASSELTRHQAFRHGKNAYGLLFHLEMTGPAVRRMTEEFQEELKQENLNGSDIIDQSPADHPAAAVYSRWAALVAHHSDSSQIAV